MKRALIVSIVMALCLPIFSLVSAQDCQTEGDSNDTISLADFVISIPESASNCRLADISPAGDVDYYWFRVTQERQVTIETILTGSQDDSVIELQDEFGIVITQNDDTEGSRASRIQSTLLPGTYHIKVRAYSDSQTILGYEIKVSTPTLSMLIFDSIMVSTLFEPSVVGTLPGDTARYSEFAENASSHSYRAHVSSSSNVESHIYVGWVDDGAPGVSLCEGRRDDSCEAVAVPPLRIACDESTEQVEFTVRAPDDVAETKYMIAVGTAWTSESEFDDTLSGAGNLGSLPSGALLCFGSVSGDDVDHYEFTLNSSNTVTIRTLTYGDTILVLYDATGSEIAYNDDVSDDERRSEIQKSLDKGTYYVGVAAYGSGTAGEYLLQVFSNELP